MKTHRALAFLLFLCLGLSLMPQQPVTSAAQDEEEDEQTSAKPDEQGLHFRLSEGAEKTERLPSNPVDTRAAHLSDAEAERLLARLPAIHQESDDVQSFKLRERSLPPPRTGTTIQAAFAPPAPRAVPTPERTTAPLEVLRFAPEGDVALAPGLTITFSQPMVAVSSQEEAAKDVPVRLDPEPKGTWRWLGAATLMFQPSAEGGRMPMATTYRVTIPKATKSALGNALSAEKSFSFSTPPPTLKRSYPSGQSIARDTLMFIEFDQRIDPAHVLERIRLQPSSEDRLRLATSEEIAADGTITSLVKQATEGRWLVFRAVDSRGSAANALPPDTNIKIVVPAGTPSMEGPRTTKTEQSFGFKTYGTLHVTGSECGYQKRCSPFDPFYISLSNQLDLDNFRPSHVRITPEIPGSKITAAYSSITIQGTKKRNTVYTVTLDPAIKDVFRQTLSGENRVTFRVNTADPYLYSPTSGFTVLDPSARGVFSVYTVNYSQLKVALYRVTPGDWQQFRRYEGSRYNQDKSASPPGVLVSARTVPVNTRPDEMVETAIDLSAALSNGYGQVFVRVEPAGATTAHRNGNRGVDRIEAWCESTDIGLDAFVDKDALVAWTSSLHDGAPLAGVNVTVQPDNVSGATDASGLARLAFSASPKTGAQNRDALLIARRGDDVAILPQTYYPYYYGNDTSTWRRSDASEELAWYVFDDRKLYRPGEEVSIKGWIRKIHLTPTGDTDMFHAAGDTVNYVLRDSRGNEIRKGSAKLNALAGFDLKLALPATMNLGDANIEFELSEAGDKFTHGFQVEEFRRPEFEVTAKASEAPHFVGTFATATMTAAYYAGGGLANTEVNWTVTSKPASYTPPNRSDYTFGKFIPWWTSPNEFEQSKRQTFKGRTDAAGKHTLRMDFDSVNPARPSSVVAEARVQDVNRQTLAASTTLLVHPADIYVGLKPARTFVQKGEQFDVAAIVTDLDGKALPNREIRIRLARLDYVYEKGQWKQKEADPVEQSVKSGTDAVRVRFQAKEGGMYRLTARVRDDRERLNETEISLWAAGGKLPPNRDVAKEKVELVPDRRTYAAGETAEILVQSPFAPADCVLTLRRSGLLRTEHFHMTESSFTLRVPIEEGMIPNIHAQVDLVGAETRVDDEGNALPKLPKRPAFASGEINLEIPAVSRRLSVTAKPRETAIEPGGETVVNVDVKDARGRGIAGADTAVVVVDESVLALTGYKLDDPMSVFYAERNADVSDYYFREHVTLANPEEVGRHETLDTAGAVMSNANMAGMPLRRQVPAPAPAAQMSMAATLSPAQPAESQAQIALRTNFNALAVFAASVPTDANGHTKVKVKLPDNLTRYRVMAVSVSGGKLFGSGESAITARQPLMVRPSAPRFLNFGDSVELPVVLQNQTDSQMNVNIAVRSTNARLTDGSGRRVTVPPNDRVEVRFPVAAEKPGTARFQIAAASGNKSDAAEISLPVYTPATTEAFATYGVIDSGAIAQPVKAPADVITGFGGLEVTTASTQLQELTDAVIYLVHYPYECSEQLSSRIIAIAALKDVLAAFKSKDLPSAADLREFVNTDMKRLQGMQNDDGGWGFWQRGDRSFPFVSVHVAHALARARAKDFAVSPDVLKKSQEYLRHVESHIPSDYSIESKRAIRAYALYVRALLNDRDAAGARRLISEAGGVEKLSLESLGWLLPVLSGDAASAREVEAIRRHFNNRVTETAGAAHFAASYSDGAYTLLQSDRRADGIILDALIGDQPRSDLIPKLVRGLLGGRRQGRWESTQENVFILLALDHYFNTYEKTTPDFVSRVWLGDAYAGEQTFRGRSVDRQELDLPMPALVERTAAGPADLVIAKEGAGRLYYRIGARYAPQNLKLEPADYGFKVERRYEAIDDPGDVRRDADGTWHIKAGARVRVHVTMSNPARRYHVALVDPLPAGLEALNPELATTEKLPDESTEAGIYRGGRGIMDFYWFWRGPWYEHQNLRDERAEAFTSLLWEGVHEYSYFARATTPGLFVVPPPKAEEMYAPETFGHGRSDRVRVE